MSTVLTKRGLLKSYLLLWLFAWIQIPLAEGQQSPLFQSQQTAPTATLLNDDNSKLSLSVGQQKIEQGVVPQGLDDCSWSSIQDQIRMGKYKAFPNKADEGYHTSNPRRGFRIAFEESGTISISPYHQKDEDYHINMRLTGLGYKQVQNLDGPKAVHAENIGQASGSKVTYQWNDNLSEWWINQENRLEQWFYLKEAPKGKSKEQSLRLRLALDTDMKVSSRKDKLTFSNGKNTINYDKFKAWDATGKALAVHFEQEDKQLDLVINDQDAQYPLTIDPSFGQAAYLKASNTQASDSFGSRIAVSGETVVICAIGEASNATGVNGDETNNSAATAGAAYVFVRTGGATGTWSQQAYLKASNTDGADQFGKSVAISGETIVVGASHEDSNATGVNGDQTDNSASASGAAYVFVRTGGLTGTWSQQAYLKASNPTDGDVFGWSVAISGETIVVGANGEDSNALGVNGDQTDESFTLAGAAYVFTRTGGLTGTWSQQAYLKASNTDANDKFGSNVAISGETIVISTDLEDSNATGVNGIDTNGSMLNAGAAYVFVRAGGLTGTWSQQAYLKASNTNPQDFFGISCDIDGETIVIGATHEDSNATGVNGDETDNSMSIAGAAYVFVRTGGLTGTWSQQAYLKASNSEGDDWFGADVGIHGDTIVVGATKEDSNATGVNGDETDNSVSSAGAAYMFTRTGGTWSQAAYLKASSTDATDFFGGKVAIGNSTILVNSVSEDSNATGVNGDDTNNSASGAGAVYVFGSVPISADLSVAASTLTSTDNQGEFQTYTITLDNAGPNDATDVKVKVQIPYGRSFVSATPSLGIYDSQAELWLLDGVPVGTETLAITFRVD